MSCGVQLEHSIPDRNRMEVRRLFVAEIRVRDPKLLPAAVVESNFAPVVERREL